MSFAFQNFFFNGDTTTDANSFDGLAKLAVGNGRTDSAPASVLTLDDLDALLLHVTQASAIMVNDKTLLKIQSLARASKLALPTIDMIGNRVTEYNGVKILRAGSYGGSTVLVDGEVYAVRLGADGVFGVQANLPSPMVYEPNSERPAYTVRIDWFAAIALGTTDSVYHLQRAIA
ncbi:hypothetical protein Q0M94_19220 (plasmid) [Deinococcus radiomollis]